MIHIVVFLMKLLGIHADHVRYKVTKKTSVAEPYPIPEDELENCVLLFTCVEKSDEISPETAAQEATHAIQKRMKNLGASRIMVFPYAHLASDLGCPGISLWILKEMQKELSDAGFETKRAAFGWYKEFEIKSKGHPMADFSISICALAKEGCGKESGCCINE